MLICRRLNEYLKIIWNKISTPISEMLTRLVMRIELYQSQLICNLKSEFNSIFQSVMDSTEVDGVFDEFLIAFFIEISPAG